MRSWEDFLVSIAEGNFIILIRSACWLLLNHLGSKLIGMASELSKRMKNSSPSVKFTVSLEPWPHATTTAAPTKSPFTPCKGRNMFALHFMIQYVNIQTFSSWITWPHDSGTQQWHRKRWERITVVYPRSAKTFGLRLFLVVVLQRTDLSWNVLSVYSLNAFFWPFDTLSLQKQQLNICFLGSY